ncbi:DNA damage-inducible protein D [Candidatus Amesbacteria bacterium RIFCSPHIGHO2_01_FULL_48_32]|uniref:DNA damage-inducible protein D n=1 Tax=Candidatus Amesbacteria bacterium RIFCSPLOWO2_01_FULL_48_25 TaxID=1797259 RepID=A0A1F4ZFT8_9BACT|nr:MAG: DNA damage-inducible protein D [Candidatus Amesbacteria bacterium RIFCSPHIGHO2_01_FULL_48_32]OGD04304.1 MAG: DNA damage-inducible protein D [Candidatus Amesbacteria bacterium RIFCSPLOWO2_01_FULL_48_25]HJZ05505.1 DNA damage-inducible protein D [Patescibacteria group bacterium]
MTQILPSSPHQDFENIKKLDENGIEYWVARELMPLLEYDQWRNFEAVIDKAKVATSQSNQNVTSHFVDIGKMVKLGSGSERKIKDYKLSRYACYLIAQNGDPSKQAIANAQTYFAIQARRQEVATFEEENKRLFIRQEVKKQNKQLFSTASRSGVRNFGKFNDLGYLGLYGLHIPKIKAKKDIGKDDILDRAGATELAANLFRITQTEEKIRKDNIIGEGRASLTHFSVGSKVRETIRKIGGTMPEDLPPALHIKKLKPSQQKLLK